tara:strand:+ start:34672 stop:35550 length:879 start_codon:yes stop_codon:yes gene_type:complete
VVQFQVMLNSAVKLSHTHVPGDSNLPPVLFIHGRGSTKDTWSNVVESGMKNEAYIIDLRGHGESIYNGVNFDLPAMAKDIAIFLNDNSLDKCIIVAHSMGSRVATYFCAEYPEYVSGLFIEDMDMKAKPEISFSENHTKRLSELKRLYRTEKELIDALIYVGCIDSKIKRIIGSPSKCFQTKTGSYYLGASPYVEYLIHKEIQESNACQDAFCKLGTHEHIPVTLVYADKNSHVSKEGLLNMHALMPRLVSHQIADSEHSIHKSNLTAFKDCLEDFVQTVSQSFVSKKTHHI